MRSTNKKTRLFFTWLLSYISIILISLIVNGIVYVNAINIIEDEINRAHVASLKQLQSIMDAKLSDIEKVSLSVVWDKQITGLLNVRDMLQPYHRYTTFNIMEDFKTYSVANSFIDDFFLYFRNQDFILNSSGKYTTKEYYNYYYQSDELSYDQWIGSLQSNQNKKYISVERKLDEGKTTNSISFMQSIPMNALEETTGTLVISMNESTIQQSIQGMEWIAQGTTFIIDKDNKVLASTRQIDLPDFLIYEKLHGLPDIFESKLGEEKVIVSHINSNIADWEYVFILPIQTFLQKAQLIKRIVVVSILLCLLGGGWAAYIFANKNYSAVHRIAGIITDKLKLANSSPQRELFDSVNKRTSRNEYIYSGCLRFL